MKITVIATGFQPEGAPVAERPVGREPRSSPLLRNRRALSSRGSRPTGDPSLSSKSRPSPPPTSGCRCRLGWATAEGSGAAL